MAAAEVISSWLEGQAMGVRCRRPAMADVSLTDVPHQGGAKVHGMVLEWAGMVGVWWTLCGADVSANDERN